MAKRNRKAIPKEELKLSEDPFLLDDPGGSPLEWIELSLSCHREAIRRGETLDPWLRTGPESDALTEHRRRKLENITLHIDEDFDSVA